MQPKPYQFFYINSQQASPNKVNPIQNQNTGSNRLQKYQVIKLMTSGDYVCNDQMGNYYLLVCKSERDESGMQQFKTGAKENFHRNGTNRALITPFEDIQYHGLVYTAFMIPERACWIVDSSSLRFKSEIFCLSLIFSLINKVIKPLIDMFGNQAMHWLHVQNIWIKENTIYYVVCKRKINKKTNNESASKSKNKTEKQTIIISKETNEKRLLRKLCNILVPHFKMDHELKSFQSILIDAMLNEQLAIDQVTDLLNDKSKRKYFLNERREKQSKNENILIGEILKQNGEFWRKKKFDSLFECRRGLKIYHPNTQTIQLNDGQSLVSKTTKNVGATIQIPTGYKSKRNTLFTLRMFDFKQKSRKQNKSLSEQKSVNLYQRATSNGVSISQDIQKALHSHAKYYKTNNKLYTVTMQVKERAYRKFAESVSFQVSKRNDKEQNLEDFTPKRYNKEQLKNHLLPTQNFTTSKSKTIQIGELKDNRSKTQTQKHFDRAISIDSSILPQKLPEKTKFTKEMFKNMRGNQDSQYSSNNERKQQKIRSSKQSIRFDTNEDEKVQLKQPLKQSQKKQEIQKIAQTIQITKEISQEKKNQAPKIQRNILQKMIEKKEKNIFGEEIQKVDLQAIQVFQPTLISQLNAKKQVPKSTQNIPNPPQKIQNNSKPPLPKGPQRQKIVKAPSSHEDELEEVILEKKESKKRKQSTHSVKQIKQTKQLSKLPSRKSLVQETIHESQPERKPKEEKPKEENDSMQRSKTAQSEVPSTCGPKKPVSKQVNEYMYMINKMGESVAKSSRISPKLEGIQWFTGIYFIYKRFLYERKQIERWLGQKQPNLTRYQEKKLPEWNDWFNSEEKKTLQSKVKAQNENIIASIVKMNKKIMKKNLPANFLLHASLSKHSEQQSKIAVSQVVREYDELEEKQKLNDQELLVHVNDLMNSLYVIAELDGKIGEKKPLTQVFRKKNLDEISDYSDFIYDLYIKEQ